MSRKCIYRSSRPAECVEVKVYRDSETEEWVARLYLDEQLYEPADYFTNDKEDACRTADVMCASEADTRAEQAQATAAERAAYGNADAYALPVKPKE